MFGHGLDPQATDLIAVKAVRVAVGSAEGTAATSVEALVSKLARLGVLDREIALYVAINPERFVLSEPPQYIEARWCVGCRELAG
jgi:hypothetical protein